MEVRWDAAVADSRFWSEPPPLAARPASNAVEDAKVEVCVWPFGVLASGVERPITMRMGKGFTLGQVVAELKARFGAGFLEGMLDCKGDLISHCRVFVDGRMIESLALPLPSGPQANVEIILLAAVEGG